MLNTPAEFPAAGSHGYLAPTGEQVRIQRRNDDGSLLISRQQVQPGIASGNITVPAISVHRTRMAAITAGGQMPGGNRRSNRGVVQ